MRCRPRSVRREPSSTRRSAPSPSPTVTHPEEGILRICCGFATEPAPQRYSLLSLDGSALAIGGLYGALEVAPGLSLGAGFELLSGFFETSVVFSACVPDRFVCAPEQPDYDAPANMRAGPIFAPSGILGAQYALAEATRIGASFHLPYWISASSKVDVELPPASVFSTASQRGDRANVSFRLPWILRLGLEQRFGDTRVEAAYVHEHWSMHDRIEVVPDGITLNNVIAFPETYPIPPVTLARDFQDTNSVRLGAEHPLDVGGLRVDVRGGLMYEQGAVPDEMLSVTTLDFDKVVLGIGASLHVTKDLRLDALYARVFTADVDVDPGAARIEPINPVDANPPLLPHAINGGTYSASANVFGLGFRYVFASREEDRAGGKRRE